MLQYDTLPSQIVKCVAPLFREIAQVKVRNSGVGARTQRTPIPIAPLPMQRKSFIKPQIKFDYFNTIYLVNIGVAEDNLKNLAM